MYNQISDIYADLKQLDKSFEYRLLAAHMGSKTSAVDWAAVGDLALTLERLEEASTCFDKGLFCFIINFVCCVLYHIILVLFSYCY